MKKIAIFYDYDDVFCFFKNPVNVDSYLPLTPNAKFYLSKKISKNILDPLDYFDDNDHIRIIKKTKLYEIEFKKIINNLNILDCSKVTSLNILNLLLNSIFYIFIIMSKFNCEFYFKSNNFSITTKSSTTISEALISKFINLGYGIFNEKRESTQYFKILNNFLIFIIFFLLKKKKIIWTTGLNYGLKNLIFKYKNKNKNLFFLYFGNANKFSILKNFYNIYKLIIYKNINHIEIIPTIVNKKFKLNNKIINFNFDDQIVNLLKNNISLHLEKIINYTESIYKSSKYIIKKSKTKKIISHQFRMLEPCLVGMIGNELGIETNLISHGTHVIPKNGIEIKPLEDQAKDILKSKYSTNNIIQSPLALEAFLYNNKNTTNYQISHPFMWGYKVSKKNKKFFKEDNNIKLLHAGTSKSLCVRPLIYETSNEYINSLNLLCDCINTFENVELIIKVRSTKECSIETIESLVKTGKNCKIISDAEFVDILEDCDYLISFSSTTIEEALNLFKPVIIYGYSNRYIHLDSDSKIIFNANKYNLDKTFSEIFINHNKNNLLKKDFYKYIWGNEVKKLDDFL